MIEDDPYGLVRFEGEPLPSLLELAPAGRVIYSCSFSKTVAPGLRVGYLVLPRDLGQAVEAIAVSTYVSPAIFTEAIVWEFLRAGLLEPNLARTGAKLRARRDAMLEALERELPDATWSRPEGGYFIWLDLPGGVDSGAVARAGRGERRDLREGQRTSTRASPAPEVAKPPPPLLGSAPSSLRRPGGESSARLAFSFVSPDEIRAGVSLLAGALDELRTPPVAV